MVDRLFRHAFDEFDPIEDCLDYYFLGNLRKANHSRYLFRSPGYRKGNSQQVFEMDLAEAVESGGDDDLIVEEPWLNDDEFLQKYRMTRPSFKILLDKIKDHPVFNPPKAKRDQVPVAYQLMTFLKYVGTEGSGGSSADQRNTFRISIGVADLYRQRVTLAIWSLRKDYIYWPSKEERKVIAREIFQQYDFPHCVSLADGKLFPLAFEPETEDPGLLW